MINVSVGDDRSFWAELAAGEQLDQRRLRDSIFGLLNRIHDAALHDDWETIDNCRMLYQLGASYCADEPFLSDYEYGVASVAGIVGDCHFAERRYREAAEEIELALRTLDAGDERRASLGLPEMSNFRPRCTVYGVVAKLKWFAPEEFADSVMTTPELVDAMEYIASRLQAALSIGKVPSGTDPKAELDRLALAELSVCKAVFRYCPEKLPAVVRKFNHRHDEQLALEPSHFRTVSPYPEGRSSHYWDFELAKLYLSGQHTPEDVHLCIELRAAAARNTFGDWPLGGLYRQWRSQGLDILRAALAQT